LEGADSYIIKRGDSYAEGVGIDCIVERKNNRGELFDQGTFV